MMTTVDAARELTEAEIEEISESDYVSNDRRELYAAIRDMKAAKILAYDKAIKEGSVDAEVGRPIISVLKTDMMIFDLLAVTDLEDRKDTAATLEMIRKMIVSSPRPEHQEDYFKTLTDNEASMEYIYSKTLERLLEMAKAA